MSMPNSAFYRSKLTTADISKVATVIEVRGVFIAPLLGVVEAELSPLVGEVDDEPELPAVVDAPGPAVVTSAASHTDTQELDVLH